MIDSAKTPTDTEEKELWRKQRQEIQKLFLNEWDPIGIKDIPECVDEYNAYANQAVSMIRGGATDHEVIAFLTFIAESHMGLGPRPNANVEQQITRKMRKILMQGG